MPLSFFGSASREAYGLVNPLLAERAHQTHRIFR
jgi:hypothetical protein